LIVYNWVTEIGKPVAPAITDLDQEALKHQRQSFVIEEA
jgi:hypothetical protein